MSQIQTAGTEILHIGYLDNTAESVSIHLRVTFLSLHVSIYTLHIYLSVWIYQAEGS